MPTRVADDNCVCRAQEHLAGGGRRSGCWRRPRRAALVVLKGVIAVRPLLVAAALAVDEAAVVNLSGRCAGGRRTRDRLRLRWGGALIGLKCPIAICPLLVGLALAVDETAIVNVARPPRQSRSQEHNHCRRQSEKSNPHASLQNVCESCATYNGARWIMESHIPAPVK